VKPGTILGWFRQLAAQKYDSSKARVGPLAKEGIDPVPEREKRRNWKQFLKSHWDTLYACDFFSVEALSPVGTIRYMV
jgi:hypothetical protein